MHLWACVRVRTCLWACVRVRAYCVFGECVCVRVRARACVCMSARLCVYAGMFACLSSSFDCYSYLALDISLKVVE